jgi:anti-repressor protein
MSFIPEGYMNDLIKINYNSERQTTSARDLWEFLERPYGKFTDWFNQYKGYGFTENEDYRSISEISEKPLGGRPAADYEITIDMAKELSMLARNEKGKLARQYFIDLEKRWNDLMMVMSRALKLADVQIKQLQGTNAVLEQRISEYEPKVQYLDSILSGSRQTGYRILLYPSMHRPSGSCHAI